MTDLCKHIAFQMGNTTLQRRSGEFFSDYGVKPFDAVCNHQANSQKTSVLEAVEDLTPACSALYWHIADIDYLAGTFFGDSQRHIERLACHRTLAVNLDMHAVHEHHWIVLLKPSFKPFVDLSADALNHAADA